MLTKFVLRAGIRGPGYWKLNTSILPHENFQTALKNFSCNWQQQKTSYDHIFLWWEKGKMYLKMLAIHYCVEAQKNIWKKQEELTLFLTTEKMKQNPDLNRINKAQNHLQDIQDYKSTGTIIRSREKLIIEQVKNQIRFSLTKKNKNKSIRL